MPTGALTLRIALPGLQAKTVALSRFRQDVADWREFWTQKFAPFFYAERKRDFVLEGGQTGDRWASLSPDYARAKRKQYPGTGILERSGALKAALLAPDAVGAVLRAEATSLEIGTSIPYAMYHQTGTRRMPQRPPIRVDDAFMVVVGRSLQTFVQEKWQAAEAEAKAAAAADEGAA